MYYADSDFLSIMLAIITMAAGIYSSLNGKNKANKHADEEVLGDKSEDEESGDFVLKSFAPVQDNTAVEPVEDVKEDCKEEMSKKIKEPPVDMVDDDLAEPESEKFKKMLKGSPKNIVLASEILNPKYKEY